MQHTQYTPHTYIHALHAAHTHSTHTHSMHTARYSYASPGPHDALVVLCVCATLGGGVGGVEAAAIAH
jgi:hypothetical protein